MMAFKYYIWVVKNTGCLPDAALFYGKAARAANFPRTWK
jgi:hypothetical protein